jgi:putative heme-binding domain-containing protein
MRLPSILAALAAVSFLASSVTAEDAPVVDMNGKTYPAPAELAKQAGDAANGQAKFTTLCGTCHQINGTGVDFGPNLSEIGSRKTKELIIESILYPSKVIEPGFDMLMIKLENDDMGMGIVATENDTDLTLKAVGGAKTTFKKSDIVSRSKLPTSIMPPLGAALSASDVANIAEYLAAQKKK